MKSSARSTVEEEIEDLKVTLREIILAREKLIAIMGTTGTRLTARRLKVAQRALGRQAQNLAIDLLGRGVTRLEIGASINATKKEADVLNSEGLRFELNS